MHGLVHWGEARKSIAVNLINMQGEVALFTQLVIRCTSLKLFYLNCSIGHFHVATSIKFCC